MAVVVETTIGDFTVDLYTKERPQTCRNFLKLCKIKYYNWNLFFMVQNNFIAQTGDPTSTGKGGESIYGMVLGEEARYYEAEQRPKIKHDKAGLLSMVNCGDNMLASQFFITLGSDLQSLDGEHCVFGEITEGLEIILKFNETICDVEHRPYQDIRISHTVILEDPYEDPKGLIVPDRSPEPTKEVLMSERIGADEEIDDTAGMTIEEINEMQKEKEAKARATILEIVGDIPDAEMAPPENVLFVCKLNPVTNDDDLEIIFSRFGKIIGCEVIRDRQTGDSLQYAFIEFSDRKSCEEAYFKMDNVLVDDRRIHVDFSQSVAKMQWRGKGRGIKYFDEENENKLKEKEKPRYYKKNRNNRKSRSESPEKQRRSYENKDKYEQKQNGRKKREYVKNDDDRIRNDKDKKFKMQDRSTSNENIRERKERSESREQVREKKEKSKSREKVRHRKERSESREKVRERRKSKEKSRDRRQKSKERSKEKKDKRERNNHYEYKSYENNHRDSRIKDEKHKKRESNSDCKSSRDREDKYSNSKKRRKSREKSEEKYEKSEHKRQHKYKSQ